MADNFSGNHLLLRYGTGETQVNLAFYVQIEGYKGDDKQQLKDVSRNPSGSLLVVRGVVKREFSGNVLLNHNATGTVTYNSVSYTYGTGDNMLTAWARTDLEVCSFDDFASSVPSFWHAEVMSPWAPILMDPMGNMRILPLYMIEK